MKHIDVMIVDDEQRYADMLARRLGLRGGRCVVCYDGRTAIAQMALAPVPLVILDLRLPDLYGVEVLTRIKQDRPETMVVIITGHGTEVDRQRCLAAGAHAFLNKPVDINRLVDIMHQLRETSA
jgi:DNA-binding response OmpR family regulator